MMGAAWLRQRGLSGRGVHIGIIDSTSTHRDQVAALVRSVAPECSVLLDSALDHDNTIAALVGALDYMIGQGVRVICMPFGFPDSVPVLMPVLRRVREKGIVLIAAAGNEQKYALPFPASSPDVIAVGMLELPREPEPDLRAPGVRLPDSLNPSGLLTGASFSCALVAGLVVLLSEQFTHSVSGALLLSADNQRLPDGQRAWEKLVAGFTEPPPVCSLEELPIDARFADSCRYTSGSIEGIAVLCHPLDFDSTVRIHQVFLYVEALHLEAPAQVWRELSVQCEAVGSVRLSGTQFIPILIN